MNSDDTYTIQYDFGSVGPVHLRDMFADVRSSLPRDGSFRLGQFPPQFTYILPVCL
ncbi:MAG: hypothetical protein NTX57_11005 [Armatimonadetes bacterium]|nr:hypothetical protein [Armatimonadota bacterium]